MKLSKYKYLGTFTAVTLRDSASNSQFDVTLFPGKIYTLPPDNQHIKNLVKKKQLVFVAEVQPGTSKKLKQQNSVKSKNTKKDIEEAKEN